jgi:predicted peptidase
VRALDRDRSPLSDTNAHGVVRIVVPVSADGVTPGEELDHDGLPYLYFAAPESNGPAPCILFLHGRGEAGGPDRGSDSLKRLRRKALAKLASERRLPDVRGRAFPFMVVAPQSERFWKHELGRLIALVDELVEKRGADPARCFVTGLSMGGFACWEIAREAPDRFAALLPLSASIPSAAMDVRHIPAWVFAGGLDPHYPASEVLGELEQFRSQGAWTTLTVAPDAGHDDGFWQDVYSRADVYEWLLAQAESRAAG